MIIEKNKLKNIDFPVADCHFHIVDPVGFPLPEGAGYKPSPEETGTAQDFAECMNDHGVTHGVAVQLSGYGFDNSAMLDAMIRSKKRIKGVAVVDIKISDEEMTQLDDAGMIGIRFNLVDFDADSLEQPGACRLLERMKEIGWFAEVQCKACEFPKLLPLFRQTGVKVLFDHLGRPDPRLGVEEPGFKKILSLADTGRAFVKLSGAFRESHEPYPYADLDPFVENLVKAYTPENLVWGSDWPFLDLRVRPSYQETLSCLGRWIPDENQQRVVLWNTPARLFGLKV